MIADRSYHPDAEAIHTLRASGVFDAAWFALRNPDLRSGGVDELTHFHRFGWRENRWPNAYFEPDSYRRRYPDVAESDGDPLLHYVRHGEAEGRRPILHFDPVWYRRAYDVPPHELCLAHFLRHRHAGTVSPVAAFDVALYLRERPDVAAAGMDPFEHYLVQGHKDDQRPSESFDPVFYRATYLAGRRGNPLLHYLAHRDQAGVQPRADPGTDIPREVARFTRPGPGFERVAGLPPGMTPPAMVLAFYLPQFHPVAENDAAWGDGFTEWTNIARGLPRFAGHYQPRIPRDLGHYRLEGTGTLHRQWAMARDAGLGGFVFYYYRFAQRRVLDGPLEALLADPGLDLPFALMWANENWTRRWDGSDNQVLLPQHHHAEDEPALVADLLRHMRDRRYIRLGGRALLMVYRMDIVPEGAVDRWRALFRAGHDGHPGEDPLFVMGQTFGAHDPRDHGMDAAVEFPPHKLGVGLPDLRASLPTLDPAMRTRVHGYDALVAAALAVPVPPFPLIRTVVPNWDNEARQPGAGTVFHDATPARYGAWLDGALAFAGRHRLGGTALVCVNAWNEWAEGAYLEPDQHWGGAFLNETARALSRVADQDRPAARHLLLIGHDAFPAGSQLLLLALARHWTRTQGVAVRIVLLAGGMLLDRFQAVAPTTVVPLPGLAALLAAARPGAAIVHSAAAAAAGPVLAAADIPFVLTVHEMPGLLRARALVDDLREAARLARWVAFATAHVRDRVGELVRTDTGRTVLLPQGIHTPSQAGPMEAARLRDTLRLPAAAPLVVGMGHADLRKGFDLFLQAWRTLNRARNPTRTAAPVHFLWLGDIAPGLADSLGTEIAVARASGTFHHLAFHDHASDWFAAADALLLSSREDPFPSAVLEAMSAGIPTVAFEDAGGIPDLLRELSAGSVVPLADVDAAARALRRLLRGWTQADRRRLSAAARHRFDFPAYAAALLAVTLPSLPDVSVAVPSFDYARHLGERLGSVFAQTAPVREVMVLDDGSADDSVAVVRTAASQAGRDVAVTVSSRPGGVWGQWRRAAERARGEWLWIAEADDSCEPGFLHAMAPALADDVVLAFADSQPVDAGGAPCGEPYAAYYRTSGLDALAQGGTWDGAEFVARFMAERNAILNVSAVLWRRTALLAAFDRCGDIRPFGGAADWRLYVEALLVPGACAAFVPQVLNRHRRHAASITASQSHAAHLAGIAAMHALLADRVGLPGLKHRQRRYRTEARRALAQALPSGPGA